MNQNPDEFDGMTKFGCAAACNANRCVVSRRPYCAHPYKGALHAADLHHPATIARLSAARDLLARDALDADLSKPKI
jgi:hypothetical protein